MTRICVALPVRNGERYLAGAIESVLAQEDADFELRVVDNLSSDRSVEIAQAYADADPRVSVVVNERDLNYYGSLNRALAETDAELFVPFACDDLFLPGNLAVKTAALDAAPEAGFVYGPVYIINGEGRRGPHWGHVDHLPDVVPATLLLEHIAPLNNVCGPGGTIIRTAALRALGGFDADNPYAADWQAWLLLSLYHPVAIVREPLFLYRQHEESGTAAAEGDGSYAHYEAAAMRRLLDDPAFPADWADRRAGMLAPLLASIAFKLRRDGHLRRSGVGPAAYAFAFEVVALLPANADARKVFHALCREAQLTPPRLPLDAVAAPAQDADSVAEIVAAGRALDAAGLLGTLAIAGEPELVPLLEAALEGGPDLVIDFISGATLEQLFRPGAAVLGPADAGLAESRGMPVLTLG